MITEPFVLLPPAKTIALRKTFDQFSYFSAYNDLYLLHFIPICMLFASQYGSQFDNTALHAAFTSSLAVKEADASIINNAPFTKGEYQPQQQQQQVHQQQQHQQQQHVQHFSNQPQHGSQHQQQPLHQQQQQHFGGQQRMQYPLAASSSGQRFSPYSGAMQHQSSAPGSSSSVSGSNNPVKRPRSPFSNGSTSSHGNAIHNPVMLQGAPGSMHMMGNSICFYCFLNDR